MANTSSWDEQAFEKRWQEVVNNDPEIKQHREEWNRQYSEWTRLDEEEGKLRDKLREAKDEEERKVIFRELEITEAKGELVYSRKEKAFAQANQRGYELRLELLMEHVNAPARELEETEGNIGAQKEIVDHWETEANEQERKLNQLQKEVPQQKNEQPSAEKEAADKEAIESQKILDDALKQGYVLLKNFIALMVGSSGVGKTCLKCLLMGKKPPNARSSTICAEHPIKIRSVSSSQFQKLHGKWKEVSSDKLLPMIGKFIRKNAKKFGVEIPPELNAYLELLKGSTTAAATSSTASGLAAMAGKSSSSGKGEGELESSSSQNEAAALDAMVESVLGSLEKLIAGEELTEEEEDELMSSVWIYFTDSGGQPQFHELLPLFIHDVSSVIIVSRLSDRLDDHPPDEYYQDGQCVGKKSSTHLTTTEQIKCLTSSLLSRSTIEGGIPNIIVVGTHRDKAHECPESIEQKNKKLLEIFGPELEEYLIYYKGVEKLLFPVNTIDPEELDREVARLIQKAVEKCKLVKEVKVPIWWFILELLIQGLAKKLGKRALSREQCVGIANSLGFSERSFNAALKFFNKLNVIKYSSALPEVVFVDSQVPLDNVSDLVQEGYLLRHGSGSSLRSGNWKRFCYEGVVTLEFMDSTCKHFEKGIFESSQLLELLKDQLVVVPLEPLLGVSVIKAEEYFMPALLDVLSREELDKHRVFSAPAAPLLFRFPCGCRRAGVFCCLVVHLMKQSKWSIQHVNKKVILVARNCITFRLPKHSCLVTLIDAFYFFEVHIAAKTKASVCQEMCPIVQREIVTGIEAASEKLHYSNDRPEVGVFCSCKGDPASLPQSDRHAALVQESGTDCACVETSVANALVKRSTVWLGLDGSPSILCNNRPATSSHSASLTALSRPSCHEAITTLCDVPQAKRARLDSCKSSSIGPLSSDETTTGSNLPHIAEYISIGSTKDEVINKHDYSLPVPPRGADAPMQIAVTVPAHLVNSTEQLSIGNLRDVLNHVYDARSKWREIGVQLRINAGTLEAIKKDHQGDCYECLEKLLRVWLRGNDPSPSWKALADALKAPPVQVKVKVVSKHDKDNS